MKIDGYRYVQVGDATTTASAPTVQISPLDALRMSTVHEGQSELIPPAAILVGGKWLPVEVNPSVPAGMVLTVLAETCVGPCTCTMEIGAVADDGSIRPIRTTAREE